MSTRKVSVQGRVPLSADACWSVVRGFCEPWHPAIAQMQAEQAGTIRAFTVEGDSGLYKERLTWFSDSARMLRYTHLQGIEGVSRYDAQISVIEAGAGGAEVHWQAEIDAPSERCDEIAAGTEAIFNAGIWALGRMDAPQPFQTELPDGDLSLSTRTLPTSPSLQILQNAHTAERPLCLFLHGIGGNKENWTAQLEAVSRIGPAAALDLRGYGGSSLGEGQSTIDDYCADISAVADALGSDKLVLCGLSYGAWIATSFAMRHSDRLAGLVLAGGCTGMSAASADEREAFRTAREVPLSQGQTPADFAAGVVEVIAGPDASAAAREALTASMSAISAGTYRDALNCFTNPPETFDFARLTMPVLMMTGTHDRLAPPSEIRAVAERIWSDAAQPSVRFEEIHGAGHVCNLEAPDAFNRPLLEFLEQVLA